MRLYFLVGFSSYSQYFDEYVTISTLFIVIERPSIFLWSHNNISTQLPRSYWQTGSIIDEQVSATCFKQLISVYYITQDFHTNHPVAHTNLDTYPPPKILCKPLVKAKKKHQRMFNELEQLLQVTLETKFWSKHTKTDAKFRMLNWTGKNTECQTQLSYMKFFDVYWNKLLITILWYTIMPNLTICLTVLKLAIFWARGAPTMIGFPVFAFK